MKKTVIGSRIKAERTRAKLNRKQLGEMIGYAPDTVRFWEDGYTNPHSKAVIVLCEAFGCSADYLLGISDDREGR